MNMTDMIANMGFVGICVMVVLLGLSVYSLGMIFDKYRRFRTAASQSTLFLPQFGQCLRDGKLQNAVTSAKQHDKSHVAQVVAAGVIELMETRETVSDVNTRVEIVSNVLDRSIARTLTDMRKGLGTLATIGSTAPFIGLFGTVVGIIHSFQGISESGSGGLAAVSGGIAEALVATALGILVAIPAVMAFNHFTGMLERFHVEMNTTSAEFIDFLNKRMKPAHANS